MTFQLRVNRQVGSLRITLLRSKLHQIETGIVLTEYKAYRCALVDSQDSLGLILG